MEGEDIVLMGCGDVGPIFEPLEPLSALVRPTLASADIRFAQCERVYSNRGERWNKNGKASYKNEQEAIAHSHGNTSTLQKPHMASVFTDCGFNVVSMAGNCAMEWGADAMLDTIELLNKKGIMTIGAGHNLEEARRPAIIEQHGVRVALIAYCSYMKKGQEADRARPGIAPLRAHTEYRSLVEDLPGMRPQIISVPYEEDLDGMVEDIVRAKKTAHVVVVSMHWGIQHMPRMIADYQIIIAEAAFKAGADLILGGHAHVPKAIAVYNGKTCFYSLGNFIMSVPAKTPKQAAALSRTFGVTMDPDYPHLPASVDSKRSLIAKVVLSRKSVSRVSFLPVLIDKQLRPEVLRAGDPRFEDAVNYIDWASEDFTHKFTIESDEVVVS